MFYDTIGHRLLIMEIFILTVYLMFCFGFASRIVIKYKERSSPDSFVLFIIAFITMPIFLGYMVSEKLWFD